MPDREGLMGNLTGGTGTLAYWIIGGVVLIVAAAVLAYAVYALAQAILRGKVGREYSVKIPSSVKVGWNRTGSLAGRFRMGYPAWSAPKRDGTRDLRTNDTRIVRDPTVILVGGWRLSVNDPFKAYDLVNAIRDAGHELALCPEEQSKLQYLTERERQRASATSISGIVISSPSARTCSALLDGARGRPLHPATAATTSSWSDRMARRTSLNANAIRHGITSADRSFRNCMGRTRSHGPVE